MNTAPLTPTPDPEPPAPFAHRRRSLLLAGIVMLGLFAIPAPIGLAVLSAAVSGRLLWAARGHIPTSQRKAARTGDGPGPLLLGRDSSGRPLVLPDGALAAHGLILGASGSGKSTTMLTILRQEIERGCPVVVIDLKGSPGFAAELEHAALASGRRFQLWSPDGPMSWNPMANGNATELKDKLIATERFTEPHYQRAAERFAQLAIQVLSESRPQQPLSLARVVTMLDPAMLAATARSLPRARGEYIREYVQSLSPDQLSAVRGLASRLAILTESHVGQYLEPASMSIDLRRSLAHRDVVLFSLNSSSYGGMSAQLGTMVVQDLVAAAGARLNSDSAPSPALVAIDEFSGLQSDNVMALLARGRASGIGVLLATQELADLDRAARGLRDQVLGNTAVKLAHRQDVPESAETVARMAGKVRVWERTYQERGGGLGAGRQRGSSVRLVDRYAIEPDRVSTLGVGEVIAIVKSPQASTRIGRVSAEAQPPVPGVTR